MPTTIHRAIRLLLAATLLPALAACASSGSTSGTPGAASTATASGSPEELADATLRPGDALQVGIWREKELSGKFIVDEEGVVTLPLLGPVEVIGVPMRELEDRLRERYRVQLRNPSIEITPLRRIYVLGEVNKPGLLAVDPTVTLAGAVAMAGGANPQGELSNLRVLRDGQVVLGDVGPETDLLSVDIRSGDQIFVERRSWFERNSSFLVSATIGAAGIVVQLLR